MDQAMILRGRQTAALALVLLAVLCFAAEIGLDVAGCSHLINPSALSPAEAYGRLPTTIANLAFPLLGALIIFYRPENRIGWMALLFGVFSMLNTLGLHYQTCDSSDLTLLPGEHLLLPFIMVTSYGVLVTLGFFLLIFPDGKFLSPNWRRSGLVMLGVLSSYYLFTINWTDDLVNEIELTNHVIPLFAFPIFGIVSLVVRWRLSRGDVAQQIKWLAFFLATAGTLFFSVEIIGINFYPEIFEGWFYFIDVNLFIVGLPLVFGVALFKYRLYDIDIIIRRTLQYAIISGLLLMGYFGSVVLLQSLSGLASDEQSPLIIVVSTLFIAALFNPVRRRVQAFIDRRFYRQQYDAQQVLAQFSRRARDEVSIDILRSELAQVIQESIQPERMTLWLRERG